LFRTAVIAELDKPEHIVYTSRRFTHPEVRSGAYLPAFRGGKERPVRSPA
jgi:hypothetical protein